MSRTLRSVAAVALTVLFLSSPAFAAPLPSTSGTTSLWSAAWQWLVELFVPDGPTGGERPDAGGGIDPDGDTENGDAGGTIDPNG